MVGIHSYQTGLDNTFTSINVSNNLRDGMRMEEEAIENTINNNFIFNYSWSGICLENCQTNEINYNIIINNSNGIKFYSNCDENIINGKVIHDNTDNGTHVESFGAQLSKSNPFLMAHLIIQKML